MTLSMLPLVHPTSFYINTTRCGLNPPEGTTGYRHNSRGNHRVAIASTQKANLVKFEAYRARSCE